MKIHVTFRPDLTLDVTYREYLDLKRQGLIVPDPPAAPTPVQTPAPAPQDAGSTPTQ